MPTAKSKAKPTPRKRVASKKKATTDLLAVLVLDMSGSMMAVHQPVVEGFNDYLKGLKDDKTGETLCTLVVFDSVYEPWHVAEPISKVDYLDGRYQPRGMTALYDAIAHSIVETDRKLEQLGRQDMKVLHVTVTDGGENSSKEYGGLDGQRRLAALVKRYERKGNWTFVYLGAGHATVEQAQQVAQGFGYVAENASLYVSSPEGVAQTTSSLSALTSTRRASADFATDTAFSDAGQTPLDYGVNDANATAKPTRRKRS